MTRLFKSKTYVAAVPWLAGLFLPAAAYAGSLPNPPTQNNVQQQLNSNQIVKDINDIVNFLGALAGVIIVANIIIGGIQYSTAGGNPEATRDAKHRITNSLMTLLIFFLLWAFLNWLIPGGVLHG